MMVGILITKLTWLFRNPWTFLLMTIMSIIFALIIGSNSFAKVTVPAYAKEDVKDVVDTLEEQSIFGIEWMSDVNELESRIRGGKQEFGLILQEDGFKIIVGIDSPNVNLLEQSVKSAYEKKEQYKQIEAVSNDKNVREELKGNPVFSVTTTTFHGDDAFIYDENLHPLFGFSLFFVIYTIGYSVFQILIEKRSGVWDRMSLSPVRKWEIYTANFIYSFFIGYVQVLIVFFVFRYIVKFDFQGTFLLTTILLIPYVLAIVALSILITSIVNSVQQFNAVIPIVSLGSAMLGGAFWPLEIVESEMMLALSKVVPITYGMEALNRATMYGNITEEVLYPVSILLLMTVVMTGIGIHLMEKRFVS